MSENDDDRDGATGWPVDVTLPGGEPVRARLTGQCRDAVTWSCRVEVVVWGADRPVPATAAWCVPPGAITRLDGTDYTGVPVLEPSRPPAWLLAEDPDRREGHGRLVHYPYCPAAVPGGVAVPAHYLHEPPRHYRPCPRRRPPLPLTRPAPRTSVDL
jgi:hypothetical protein